jgi:succinyl-diaminopimelate desuccinylase
MKGGLAAMVSAARALVLARVPLKGDLVLLLTADEEVDQSGARTLAGRSDLGPAQALVIAEPSYNSVYVAEKGQFWIRISTFGKAAHGSMPHLGQNAIMMMVALLEELERLQVPYREHPLLGAFSRSVGTIQGGIATDIVPERCTVTVDQRTVPGQDHAAVLGQVRSCVAQLSERIPGFQAQVEVTADLPPVETSADDPAVKAFCSVVEDVTGSASMPAGVSYTTDAALLAPALGSPMILCGPGNPELAHQPDKHVEVRKLVEATQIFALAAARLLGY